MGKNNKKYLTAFFCLAGLVASLFFVTGKSMTHGSVKPATEPDHRYSVKADSMEDTIMLQTKIDEMKMKRGPKYIPRTRHLRNDGSAKYTNRLFLESSPYLLQHAHNPVNWYPWGPEAFDAAKKKGLPLFVSIGYSTCHWCHVMEEESFEDEEIAAYINGHYIPVKVDREERPDVDSVYMSAVQIMTGSGGWPLNVWLTPDLIPFYGGTYFPPRDGSRGASTGFLTILRQINDAYSTKQDTILSTGTQLTSYIKQSLSPPAGKELPDASLVKQATNDYKKIYDSKHGGTTSAPKFPSTINLRLLLRDWQHTGDPATLEIVTRTLIKMAEGGINDQVGGGFHRYATDSKWLVPHFEKMLYDNALLSVTYLEAFQATGNKQFKAVTEDILNYVITEMTSENGGFYSATDADTITTSGEKEEGYFFTWTEDELKAVLSKDDFAVVKRYYSIGPSPNFEGRHILNISESPAVVASDFGLTITELEDKITRIKAVLYKDRQKKAPPFTDTKVLTSWNALMISAFAKAGIILDDTRYIEVAKKAGDFILTTLVKDQRLYRSYKDDMVKYLAYLDDYACLVASLIDLYEATGDIKWLEKAILLNNAMTLLFKDELNGGFFMTSEEHETLPAKEKPVYDGATPSGNSIAVLNLLRLYSFTTDSNYLKQAEKTFIAFSEGLTKNPISSAEMLIALDYYHDSPKEIIIVTPENSETAPENFLDEYRKTYTPNRILVVTSEGKRLNEIVKIVPLVKGKVAVNQKTTVFICEKGVCRRPVYSPAEFRKQLASD